MIMRLTYRTIVVFYSLRTSRILSPLPYVVILFSLISGNDEPTLCYQGVTGNRLIRSVCPYYVTILAISVRDIAHVLLSFVSSFIRECFSSETNKLFIDQKNRFDRNDGSDKLV